MDLVVMTHDLAYQQVQSARRAALHQLLAGPILKEFYCGMVKGTVRGLLHIEFITTNDERLFEARLFDSFDLENLPPSTLIVPSPHIPDMQQRVRDGMSLEQYLDEAFERQKNSIVNLLFEQVDEGWKEEP